MPYASAEVVRALQQASSREVGQKGSHVSPAASAMGGPKR